MAVRLDTSRISAYEWEEVTIAGQVYQHLKALADGIWFESYYIVIMEAVAVDTILRANTETWIDIIPLA